MTRAADPIDSFWHWWRTARVPLAEAIERRAVSEWSDALSAQVEAIDPALSWELGPGARSAHHLCISAEGDIRLRITAERWLSRAPRPDELWEYYPARQRSGRDPKKTLHLDEVELPYPQFRVGLRVHEPRRLIDVVVFHPRFEDLTDGQRSTAAFLMLDDALGEDGVERWIRKVSFSLDAKEAPLRRQALIDEVERMEELPRDSFGLLKIERDDGIRLAVTLNFGVKRIDHILMDTHIAVTIRYPAGTAYASVGDDLNAMQDTLVEALGGNAVYVGHETNPDRRVVHLHAASAGPAQATLAHWERMYPTWDIETVARDDPQWSILRRW
jgi:hypothetical protein